MGWIKDNVIFFLLALAFSGADIATASNYQDFTENIGGNGEAQLARFEIWLRLLRTNIDPSRAPNVVADKLLLGGSRIWAFNLEALGRLYRHGDKKFNRVRTTFKSLEDAIGGYRKWDERLKAQEKIGAPPERIAQIKHKREQAKTALVELLAYEDWLNAAEPKLESIAKFLKNYPWKSYEDDRTLMLESLLKQLKKLDKRKYDLTRLEEGNGLHELRREIRWFTIMARMLNGMIQFKSDFDRTPESICPIPRFHSLSYNKKLANSPYSQIRISKLETNPCYISKCLFLAAINYNNKLADLKDKVERKTMDENDKVPRMIARQANRLYAQMIESKLIEKLRSELLACHPG